jgi:hypothetical protein
LTVAATEPSRAPALAMYGYRFPPISADTAAPSPECWPAVDVVVRRANQGMDTERRAEVGVREAVLQYAGGRVSVERDEQLVVVESAEPMSHEALRHPFLAFPAAVLNHWAGRSTLHAGGFVVDAGAVLVLGEKGTGKSTLVAAAAAAGLPVVSDDLAVLEGTDVLAGPRCIDLRGDVAASLGGRPLGVVGARERWRVELPPAEWRTPVAALVRLRDGDEVAMRRTEVDESARTLFGSFALGAGPGRAEHGFDLLRLPMWDVVRPRDVAQLSETLERIVEVVRA